MAFTELERINTELEWFMELHDALNDGRTEDVAESVSEAIRELRRLRKLLIQDLPIDSAADEDILNRVQFAISFHRANNAERLANKLRRYLEITTSMVDTILRKSSESS